MNDALAVRGPSADAPAAPAPVTAAPVTGVPPLDRPVDDVPVDDVPVQPGAVLLPDGTTVYGRGRRQPPPVPAPDHGLYLHRRSGLLRTAREPDWPAEWLHWPDFGIPRDGERAAAAIRYAYRLAREGGRVEVVCGGGTGRTGTVVACMAVLAGHPAEDAVAWTRAHYRPRAVETPAQRRWVLWFAGRST